VTSGDAAFSAAFQLDKSHEVDAVIAGAKKRGIQNPAPLVQAHLANLEKWEKWEKKSMEIGMDVDKFEKVLWERVYSKIK
jgi:hypothetical protein